MWSDTYSEHMTMTLAGEHQKSDFRSLLTRRAGLAATVIVIPMVGAVVLSILLLQMHTTSARLASVFSLLKDATVRMEYELAGAHRSTGDERRLHLVALRTHYLTALRAYTALRVADPDGDALLDRSGASGPSDELLRIAELRGVRPREAAIDFGIDSAEMPKDLAAIWETEAGKVAYNGERDIADGRLGRDAPLEDTMARALLAVETLITAEDPDTFDVRQAMAVVSFVVGPVNHRHMERVSAAVDERTAWSVRLPIYFILGIFAVTIAALLFAVVAIVRPLARNLGSMQANLTRAPPTQASILPPPSCRSSGPTPSGTPLSSRRPRRR